MENLIIGSGSLNGFYYIGILKHLIENNKIQNIKNYYGCSIGSILVLLLSIGYTIEEIEEITLNIDFTKFLNEFNINFLLRYNCIYNNLKIAKYIKKLLVKKGLNEDITFEEHYNKFNIYLHIATTNINENKSIYLSVLNNSNLYLWKAILMSISLPLIFPAIKYENNYYLDGGLLDPYPIDNSLNMDKTILITYKQTNNIKIEHIENYLINDMMNYVIKIFDLFIYSRNKLPSICNNIYCPEIDSIVPNMQFNMSKGERISKIEKGYEYAKNINIV